MSVSSHRDQPGRLARVAVLGALLACAAAWTSWGYAQSPEAANRRARPDRRGAAADAANRLFVRDNLVAWCIVPFDSQKRGPEERAAMLQRLGFRHFAYDWRAEHI